MKSILFLIFAVCFSLTTLADSPLTSTSLCVGYESNPLVKAGLENKKISKKQFSFLTGKGSINEKLAIVSALGWGEHAQGNCDQILAKLIKARKSQAKFTVDDNLVMAYAQALGDYFDMSKTKPYFDAINFEDEKRESAIWVLNLCVMQNLLDDQERWCEIYQRLEAIRTLDGITRDMKPETLTQGLYEYLDIYKDTCTGDAEPPRDDEEK